MNKKTGIAVAVVVLAGAWWAAAAYTSRHFEETYRAQIAQLDKLPFVQVNDLKFAHGLTSGTVSGRVALGCKGADGQVQGVSVGLEQTVLYGPFPGWRSFGAARTQTRVVLDDAAPAALRAFVGQLQPQDLETDYGYGGTVATRVHLPAGHYVGELPTGKLDAQWSEARFEGHGRFDGALDYSGKLASFAMSQQIGPLPAQTVKYEGVALQGESVAAPGHFWLRTGHQTSTFAHGETSTGGVAETLDQISVDSAVALHDELADSDFGYHIGKMHLALPTGQPVDVTKLDLQVKLKNLHAPTVEKLVDQVLDGVSASCAIFTADPASVDPQARAAAVTQAFAPIGVTARELLLHRPELTLDKLGFEMNGKRGEFSASAKLAGLDAAQVQGAALLPALMQAVSAQASGRVPVAWLGQFAGAQAEGFADQAVAGGMAKRDGDFLTSEFAFEKGVARVNGHPLGQPAVAQ
ncbi:MAG: DUF945 family protein [Pelomonas sp.]|nr:DUF945 family protein [Roseateles sp.]